MADAPQGARTTGDDARRWLATMPGQVAGQRSLLESLITTAQDEPAFRWPEFGGSLARGAGDELSDIDAGLGIADDGWDEGLAAAAAAVRAAGPVTDEFRQRFPGKDGQPADFSADNVPYHPAHHLSIASSPLEEGDLVIIAGYPGRTSSLKTKDEVQEAVEWYYPRRQKWCEDNLAELAKISSD